MKNILKIVVIVFFTSVLFSACSDIQVESIKYKMPETLVGSVDVETYISEYAIAGGSLIMYSNLLMSDASFFTKAKVSAQMSKTNERVLALKAEYSALEASLNENQKKDFKSVVYTIEASIGQRRLNMEAMDESEVAANASLKNKQDAEIDAVSALPEENGRHVNNEEAYQKDNAVSSNQGASTIMFVLISLIVLAGFVFGGIAFVRRMKNKVSDIGHTMSDMKSVLDNAKDKVKEGEAEGKTLSEEQKKAFEFLDKHIN